MRQTEGYLPTSEIAFVDEIFKANSAILNALLTLLNERMFDNGNQRLEAPLLCLIGASNELPESEELDALYDRFLVRRTVAQVRLMHKCLVWQYPAPAAAAGLNVQPLKGCLADAWQRCSMQLHIVPLMHQLMAYVSQSWCLIATQPFGR